MLSYVEYAAENDFFVRFLLSYGEALHFAVCSVYAGVLAILLRGGPAPPRPAEPLRSRPHHVHQHYRRLHFKQVNAFSIVLTL